MGFLVFGSVVRVGDLTGLFEWLVFRLPRLWSDRLGCKDGLLDLLECLHPSLTVIITQNVNVCVVQRFRVCDGYEDLRNF